MPCQDRGAENRQEHCLNSSAPLGQQETQRTTALLQCALCSWAERSRRLRTESDHARVVCTALFRRYLDLLDHDLGWCCDSQTLASQCKRMSPKVVSRRPAAELWTMASHGLDKAKINGTCLRLIASIHICHQDHTLAVVFIHPLPDKTTNITIAASTASSPSSSYFERSRVLSLCNLQPNSNRTALVEV